MLEAQPLAQRIILKNTINLTHHQSPNMRHFLVGSTYPLMTINTTMTNGIRQLMQSLNDFRVTIEIIIRLTTTMNYHKFLIPFFILLVGSVSFHCSPTQKLTSQSNFRIYDAHGHLSLFSQNALDSLIKYNVYGVRDCGGDWEQLKSVRERINQGQLKGPKLFISGPFLDGPKKSQRSSMTLFIANEAEAIKAVDSLYFLGVDFIKTHNGLSRESYFAILKQARVRKLKVVSHLPKGVPAWEAATHGVSCIEHVAESILASPIYAGYAKSPKEAASWWLTSPKADSLIKLMADKEIFVTPTLVAFKSLISLPENKAVSNELKEGLDDLMKITLKLHKGGVRILTGSDFNSLTFINPGQSIHEEIKLLIEAGLSDKEARDAASKNFERWLRI